LLSNQLEIFCDHLSAFPAAQYAIEPPILYTRRCVYVLFALSWP
jgi:hypothetical protein